MGELNYQDLPSEVRGEHTKQLVEKWLSPSLEMLYKQVVSKQDSWIDDSLPYKDSLVAKQISVEWPEVVQLIRSFEIPGKDTSWNAAIAAYSLPTGDLHVDLHSQRIAPSHGQPQEQLTLLKTYIMKLQGNKRNLDYTQAQLRWVSASSDQAANGILVIATKSGDSFMATVKTMHESEDHIQVGNLIYEYNQMGVSRFGSTSMPSQFPSEQTIMSFDHKSVNTLMADLGPVGVMAQVKTPAEFHDQIVRSLRNASSL
jgi:hypothetical protein